MSEKNNFWKKELSELCFELKDRTYGSHYRILVKFICALLSQSQTQAKKRGYEKGIQRVHNTRKYDGLKLIKCENCSKARAEERERFSKILAGLKMEKFKPIDRERNVYDEDKINGYNQAVSEINKKILESLKELDG